MDRASERVQTGALLGAAVLAVGMVLPLSAPNASTAMDGAGLFIPGSECGPAETQVGTTGGFLARVRADAGAQATRRRGAAAKALAQQLRGTRQAARRPSTPLPRSGAKAPPVEQESRAAVLRSFYTCNTMPLPNLTGGTGWRLVGPLRHS